MNKGELGGERREGLEIAMDEATGAEFKLESAIGRARNRALKSKQLLNERRGGRENANKVIGTDSSRGSGDRAIRRADGLQLPE